MIKLNCIAAAAVVAWASGQPAAHAALPSMDFAQSYPNRPLRLIAPFPPGGPTDIIGRVVAQKLGENLKQNIVVDNRGGATGVIGMELAAKSAPDGYTLVIGSSANLAVNPALSANLPYDALRDFHP